MRWLLILLCACRFSWSAHQGAPPRSANDITMTLYAPDEQSMTLARSVLGRDPHVKLLEFDPTVIEKQKTTCGTPSCQHAVDAACSWSALQGAEYYAIATVSASYHSDFKCTQYDSNLFDKNDTCVDGHETNKATVASYNLEVFDVKTCKQVTPLSQRITTRAFGDEEQSKPEALAMLAERAPAKSERLPEQLTIGTDGRVAGEAGDGFYAVFRAGNYRGYAKLTGAGTPNEEVRAMYFPLSPTTGDALVARGRRKFVDLTLDGAIASLTYGGDRELAGGIGAHVRHYSLDGGFQYGFGVDLLGSANATAFLFTPEIGWGVPIAPGFVLSANLGAGLTRGAQVLEASDMTVTAYEPHAIASARLQTFLTTWFYVTADVGFVYTGTLDNWDGINQGEGRAMSIRSPIARLYAGFDL